MREVELKSVVDNPAQCRRKVEQAGGRLTFEGRMVDRYYTNESTPGGSGTRLRIRTYHGSGSTRAELTWKGHSHHDPVYKVREELTAQVEDGAILRTILERTGFLAGPLYSRDVACYSHADALLRFEQFPRMDCLLEVEGAPVAIEQAIRITGIPRERFTAEQLRNFVERFEQRTGTRALLNSTEDTGAVETTLAASPR